MTVSSASSTGSTATPSSTSSSGTTTSTASLGSTNPSGIDWNNLIQAEVNNKLAAATTVQTSITANEAKIAAYQKMQTLLSNLAASAQPFSTSNTTSLSSSAFSAST